MSEIQAAGSGWRVTLEGGASLDVDEVNIRHGTLPTMKTGFPELWERYEPVRRTLPHLIPEPWPTGAWAGL